MNYDTKEVITRWISTSFLHLLFYKCLLRTWALFGRFCNQRTSSSLGYLTTLFYMQIVYNSGRLLNSNRSNYKYTRSRDDV
jgi:hypothetical protein